MGAAWERHSMCQSAFRRRLWNPYLHFGYFRLLSDVLSELPISAAALPLKAVFVLPILRSYIQYYSQNVKGLFSPNTINRLIFVMESRFFLWNTSWIFKSYLDELHAAFRLLMLYFSICLLDTSPKVCTNSPITLSQYNPSLKSAVNREASINMNCFSVQECSQVSPTCRWNESRLKTKMSMERGWNDTGRWKVLTKKYLFQFTHHESRV